MNKEEMRKKKRALLVKKGLAGKRGAVGVVTMAMVERVGTRVSKGLPITYALALEDADVTLDAFHKALERNPKLSTHLARYKAKFIELAVEKLTNGEMADLKWLLVRRHPDIFAMPSEREAKPEGAADTVVAGMQELINRSRELAKRNQQLQGETPERDGTH